MEQLSDKEQLLRAEEKAKKLFVEIEKRGLIKAGKTEKELNTEIFKLAYEMYGIKKYWHKRIVRSGINTLEPYKAAPKNLIIAEGDILFFDFGPIFEIGRQILAAPMYWEMIHIRPKLKTM